MYHRKLEGEQNHLGVQGHRATRTSRVSWSAPDGCFVTLACNLAFFSQVDGRACRSKTLAVNQEHTVFSHGLSREVGMVYDVPQGRIVSESLMLQVFLQLVGSADIAASRFGSRLFGLKIQIHPLEYSHQHRFIPKKHLHPSLTSSSNHLDQGCKIGFMS